MRGNRSWGDLAAMSQRSVPSAPGSAAQEALRERRDFARSFDSLEQIFAMVRLMLDARGVSEADAYAIAMAIEELFTNMVKYSRESTQDIAIGLDWTAPMLTVRLRDFDVNPFDVTQPPPAGR